MKPVKLKDVADHLQMIGDGLEVYISTKTGEIFEITDEMQMMAMGEDEQQPDWAKDMLPDIRRVLSSDEFILLADQYEINSYSIMENFCLQWPEENLRDKMLNAIRGSGAFRRFKNLVIHRGIEKEWYQFKDDALKEIARGLLEEEGIPYIDGGNG